MKYHLILPEHVSENPNGASEFSNLEGVNQST